MRTNKLSTGIFFILLFGCFFRPTLLLGQMAFSPGFLVMQNSDTVKGKVETKAKPAIYNRVNFQSENASTIEVYAPDDILGFGFENGVFYTSQIKENHFVEELTIGHLSLYKFANKYLVRKVGMEDIMELNNNYDTLVDAQNKTYLKNAVKWRGILKLLTSDCEMNLPVNFFEKIRFDDRSLTEFVKKYNACLGGYEVEKQRYQSKFKLETGFLFSIGLQNLRKKNTSSSQQLIYLATNNPGMKINAGIPLKISSQDLHERAYVQTGLFFSYFNYNGAYEESRFNIRTEYVYNLTLRNIHFPLSIIYTFPKEKSTPYVQFGPNIDFQISSEAVTRRTDYFSTGPNTIVISPLSFKSFQPGIHFGTGIIRNQGSVSTRTGIQVDWIQNVTRRSATLLTPLHIGFVCQLGLNR